MSDDENSNSMTSFTVNLSACQSIIHEEEAPGEIDLQSLGEEKGQKGIASSRGKSRGKSRGGTGGGGGNSDRISVTGSAVRNALTRVENEEFRKDDVGLSLSPSFSLSLSLVSSHPLTSLSLSLSLSLSHSLSVCLPPSLSLRKEQKLGQQRHPLLELQRCIVE
jgi:hypothetical protein